ncbi:MAG: CopG family transcriptional regulator [Saccharolobus sp.]|jgi:post-segregation antitoxin (ccd killing protein)|uniref:CopG family transcriptional regulator n=1 Tax=Saccharolobus sp. TaxID=2100761 RepID=UPI0028CD49C5|nr:CopG family transcriptional regulator [Saccharolobus sp.]MDT7862741.1 CopG family transcriptional regulator [Saccharolobus sp.]
MGKTVVISVRIPEELQRELKKYGINEVEVIRRALINEVKKAKAKELEGRINEVADILKKIPFEDVVKSIREDRESR